MKFLNWIRSKPKPRKVNKEVEKILKKSKSLDEIEGHLLDERGGKHSFDPNWVMRLHNKRKSVDMALFKRAKRALALKRQNKFYSSEAQIADRLGISQTTIALIRKAKSFKQYKDLRRSVSNGRS